MAVFVFPGGTNVGTMETLVVFTCRFPAMLNEANHVLFLFFNPALLRSIECSVPFGVPLFYEILWSGMEARNEKPLQTQGFCKGLKCENWYG